MTAFTIHRSALLPMLAAANDVAPKRNTMPILSSALFSVDEETVTVRATDLDLAVEIRGEAASVEAPGGFALPCALLYGLVRGMPESAEIGFRMEEGGGRVKVTAGRFRSAINMLPAADFPTLPEPESGAAGFAAWTMPGKLLAAALEATRFAVSSEETRYYLNGVFMHPAEIAGERVLTFVATDGHRLARVALDETPEGAETAPGAILPRLFVERAAKAAGDAGDKAVAVTVTETKAMIEWTTDAHSWKWVSKLIDGTFPDYNRVIPSANENVFEADRAAIASAAAMVERISSERGRAVRMAFEAGAVAMTVSNPDTGEATAECPVEQVSGEAVTIGFNSVYLASVLGALTGDGVRIELGDPGSPARFTGSQEAGGMRRDFVVMPMRV